MAENAFFCDGYCVGDPRLLFGGSDVKMILS